MKTGVIRVFDLQGSRLYHINLVTASFLNLLLFTLLGKGTVLKDYKKL